MHDLSHVVYEPQLPSTQSVAQGALLHVRVSVACGHASPPFTGAVLLRLRDWKPLPHDLVHVE